MVILYCPLSPYGYPLLSAITLLWLSVIVRHHPMIIRYCPLSPYGYPLLSAITQSVIVRYHPIRYCLLSPYGYDYQLVVRYHAL